MATHEEVEDDCLQIALEDALKFPRGQRWETSSMWKSKSKEFGRIATRTRKRHPAENQGKKKEALFTISIFEKKKMYTGVVQRYVGKNIALI